MTTSIRAGIPRLMEAANWIQPALWYECPWDDIGRPGGVEGVTFEDAFERLPTLVSGSIVGNYASFVDAGGALAVSTTDPMGSLVMTVDADDDQEACIQAAYGPKVTFNDPGGTLALYDIWFDAQFELSALVGNSFFGFMEYFTPAGDHITNAGALADKGLIGFSTLEATPTILNLTYKKTGTAVQVPIVNTNTMVAATKVSVGFHYRSVNPTARRITAFVNNVRLPTGITKAMMALATFPGANVLAPTTPIPMVLTAAIKNVTDITATTLYRWRMAMVKV